MKKETNHLTNGNLSQLINGNSLINLPSVTFTTNNLEIDVSQRCKEGPMFLGASSDTDYTQLCFNMCGSVGRVIHIEEGQQYFYNDVKLTTGAWCVLNQIKCNLNTGYVAASINGAVCRSKYPNLFGGQDASMIIACGNEYYSNGPSVLWDYLNNEPVLSQTVVMSDENERLPDNTFRFQCKYGNDILENPYIPHPLNRFEPLRDPCKKTIYKAPFAVHAKVTQDNWECDCGNFSETRVKRANPTDPHSYCTSCVPFRGEVSLKVPFDCFTINSAAGNLPKQNPCNAAKFTTYGNICDLYSMRYDVYEKGPACTRNLQRKIKLYVNEAPAVHYVS